MINPRKLAAIDTAFLGSKFIIAEFAGGVVLGLALGAFVLQRGDSFKQVALGLYLISLGINYVPMLIYAVAIARGESARAELGGELGDKRRAMAKYRRQSLLLLVPLLVPVVALSRLVRQRGRARRSGGLIPPYKTPWVAHTSRSLRCVRSGQVTARLKILQDELGGPLFQALDNP